jgi:hypothetical protein
MGNDPAEKAGREIDRMLTRESLSLWKGLEAITELMEKGDNMGVVISEIRVKGPDSRRDGFMAVIKAVNEDGRPLVAFRSGESVKELVQKIASDHANDRLTYKDDTPWDPDGARARAKAAQAKKDGA